MRQAVFLDRDGTIIEDVGYLHRLEDIRLIPGAAKAIRLLNQGGWVVIVVTNQSAVARGLITERDLKEIHRQIDVRIMESGAYIDGWYYCPHHPDGVLREYAIRCECRKPLPGMILSAAREHGINLAHSWMIGDSEVDVQAGRAAGTKAVWLGVDAANLLAAAAIVAVGDAGGSCAKHGDGTHL